MVILKTQSEFGHAAPPETPYSITSNLPGWNLNKAVRDGDMSCMARVVHIYPRFSPMQHVATVSLPSLLHCGPHFASLDED
jgi:cystathionine gamma-synthase